MEPKKSKVIVVGGGTSGWLTAALIQKFHGNSVKVSLVASKEGRPIGVGEATVPTLKNVLKILEIPEADIFSHCNGTFKLAIKFENWRKPENGKSNNFYHPFGHMPKRGLLDLSEYWLQARHLNLPISFSRATSMIPMLCDRLKAPKDTEDPEFKGCVEYAYHLDASLLGNYLKTYCQKLGVEFLESDIEEVILHENGKGIKYLQSRQLGPLDADLYVDCSGFRSLLLGDALREPFVSYISSLPCDRALAGHLPTSENSGLINNFTTANAMKGGWAWHIPLQSRAGVGYVYSSSHLTDEAAVGEFQEYLPRTNPPMEFQKIQIRAGRHERAWVHNCVAVGLAGGFVEPLESSGLAFIYTTAQAILPLVHGFVQNPNKVERFNHYIAELYDLIRDFLILHYCTTNRDDTDFWRDCRESLFLPEGLKKKLILWKKQLPREAENQSLVNFNNYNVLCILAGMDFLPPHAKTGIAQMSQEEISAITSRFNEKAKSFATHLPDHGEYLSTLKKPRHIR